jgi:hypothetical protein
VSENHPAIYGLVDPRDGSLRYVGKTSKSVSERLYSHVNKPMAWLKTPLAAWIVSLRLLGLRPEAFVIEYADGFAWREAEAFWIAYFRMIGADLLNVHSGGDSRKRLRRKLTDEEKLSARYGIPVEEMFGGRSKPAENPAKQGFPAPRK